ncbi:hypothetical protein HC891_10610 [Candidatus Gracilibacteria bacterium]|nr:hypothetical protein [Candidatus Gracilibacteria bacterium]
MPQNIDKQLVKEELVLAIQRFIERQFIVAQVIKDLGLHLDDMEQFGAIAWGWSPERNLHTFQQWAIESNDADTQVYFYISRRSSKRTIQQRGTWIDVYNQTWEYFLHGRGCDITNTETGEPIDWDCADINAFDAMFFVEHLQWQLQQVELTEHLSRTKGWLFTRNEFSIYKLIDELKEDGVLIQQGEKLKVNK